MRDCSNNWNGRWPNLGDSRNIVETFSNVNNLERETEREKERLCKKIQKILPLSRRYNYYPRRVRDCWNNWNGQILEMASIWKSSKDERLGHGLTTVFPPLYSRTRVQKGEEKMERTTLIIAMPKIHKNLCFRQTLFLSAIRIYPRC